jgi:hypothetical protein
MRRAGFLRIRGLICLALVAAVAGGLWAMRTPILTWYYIRGLSKASEEDRDEWVDRVVGLDEAAVPALLACLQKDNAQVCANARAALVCLVQHWGPADGRSLALANRLTEAFPGIPKSGQQEILELEGVMTVPGHDSTAPATGMFLAAGRILINIAEGKSPDLQTRSLALADILVDQQPSPRVLRAIRALTRIGLRAKDATSRARGLRLARSHALSNARDLLQQAIPLLRDPSANVRRQAICAVGLRPDLISSEDLLPWLHDPDKEVRRWCEKALRSPQRNLSEVQVELGRLITDNNAHERLKAFRYLRRDNNLEPGVWIMRLSYDPEDAVRIAAARAAAEHRVAHLADRLQEMARGDRSPTVRQEAAFYQSVLPGLDNLRGHVAEFERYRPK